MENEGHGSIALFYPALSLLLNHLPASVLTLKGFAALLATLLSPKELHVLSFQTASEVCISLADNDRLQDPLRSELTGLLVANSIAILTNGYLKTTQAITPESAATLVLKVMNCLWCQKKGNLPPARPNLQSMKPTTTPTRSKPFSLKRFFGTSTFPTEK